jgi:hypothetical protein
MSITIKNWKLGELQREDIVAKSSLKKLTLEKY